MDQSRVFHYAAFMSYRHSERDKPVAAALHRQLETFTFPAGEVRRQAGKKKFGRVFRDKDELPLAGDLPQALQNALWQSEWFVCLLCDEYFESPYCVSELRYFVHARGLGNVIPVITSGLAPDVFPKFWNALRGVAEQFSVSGMPYEPLAMEISGKNQTELIKNLKNEKLRLFARMLNVDYDTLFRRFHRRKVRRIAAVSAAAVVIVSAFAVGAVFSAVQIEKQRAIAVKNEMHLLIQRSIADSDAGDNLEAARKALDAYTRYGEVYPDGNPEIMERILSAFTACAYSQPYQIVQNIQNENRLLTSLCFSPDDNLILGISGGGTVLIDAANGELLAANAYAGAVDAVQFSPSGNVYMAADFWSGNVGVYSASAPARTAASYEPEADSAPFLSGAAFISEDSILLSNYDGTLTVWDYTKNTSRVISDRETLLGTMMMSGAAVSPDGSLAVCSLDYPAATLPVIDLKTGARQDFAMPVELGGRVFAFSPDGKSLAGAFMNTIVVWDTGTRQTLWVTQTGFMDVGALVFSPDGKTLAASSFEGVLLLQVSDGELLHSFGKLDLQAGYVQFSAMFSPDGKEILVLGGAAEVYDVMSGALLRRLSVGRVISAAYSHDGRFAVLITTEGAAGIFSTPASATAVPSAISGGELYEYPQWFQDNPQPEMLYQTHYYDQSMFFGMPAQLSNSPDGRFIAMTYPDGFVEVWDAKKKDGKSSYLLREHIGLIMQTRMTDRYLLTAGYDGRVMVFDLHLGETVRFISPGERIPRFELSEDGGMIIILTESCTSAHVYDLHSGTCLYILEADEEDRITDIGFTTDGREAVIVKESGAAVSGVLFHDFETLLDRASMLTAG